MKTDEQIQKELEEAGLDVVDRDVAENLRGTVMFKFMRGGRGYIYPTKDGDWGFLSEDFVVSDLAAEGITENYTGARRCWAMTRPTSSSTGRTRRHSSTSSD